MTRYRRILFNSNLFILLLFCHPNLYKTIRDNMEWLGRAANWAKFTATASLGVIHKVLNEYCYAMDLYRKSKYNSLYSI